MWLAHPVGTVCLWYSNPHPTALWEARLTKSEEENGYELDHIFIDFKLYLKKKCPTMGPWRNKGRRKETAMELLSS